MYRVINKSANPLQKQNGHVHFVTPCNCYMCCFEKSTLAVRFTFHGDRASVVSFAMANGVIVGFLGSRISVTDLIQT
jgi:hypothetical protein